VVRATHEGAEVWAEVKANKNGIYWLHVVEREAMQQVISADAMGAALDKDGFIALDVHFATGKSEILSESRPIIDEIVALLQKRPDLRVGVEGHTDNTGTPQGNKALAEARARAVAAAVAAAGIADVRLAPVGFGQERPVADNRTEEGRAKNRRVEIVKK
jgi:outer membrane protein OmpA-like peptidoglycan-associated protein